MTRIAHIADLHFGEADPMLIERLLHDLNRRDLDAVVVAGDLTAQASPAEFAAARDWFRRLAPSILAVPGNHDVPSWNLLERFLTPTRRFAQAIPNSMRDPVTLGDCVIYGFDTTARWQPHLAWHEGTAHEREIRAAAETLAAPVSARLRLITLHHPIVPPAIQRARPIRRAENLLRLFADRGIDVVLSGHLHRSFIHIVSRASHPLVMVGAPTALSGRTRDEPNGYWLIDRGEGRLRFDLMLNDGSEFRIARSLDRRDLLSDADC